VKRSSSWAARRWGYPLFWGVMATLGLGLVAWFRRRGWIGTPAGSVD
jgi:hypothetical protein